MASVPFRDSPGFDLSGFPSEGVDGTAFAKPWMMAGWRPRSDAKQMKRFLVFTYYVGRPLGGMKDFLDAFDSPSEALDNVLSERNRYYQVVDRQTMQVVKEGLSIYKNFVPDAAFKNAEGGKGLENWR
jgi:hypothetical protein